MRFIIVFVAVAAGLLAPAAAGAAHPYHAGRRVTLLVAKAGGSGVIEELLPDQCGRVTVTLKAPRSSVGKPSGASVTTVSGRRLHAFGKIRRRRSSWKLRPLRSFAVTVGLPFSHVPRYRIFAVCVLTKRGANEYNALSGFS